MSTEQNDPKLSETNWFPHDIDSHSDLKTVAMVGEYGAAGYGLYWYVVELIHADPDVCLPFKPYVFIGIAHEFKMEAEQVEKWVNDCIDKYELLTREGSFFTSNRAKKNRNRKQFVREQRKIAASKGGKTTQERRKHHSSTTQAPLEHHLSKGKVPVKQIQVEERRGEEISIDISSTISCIQDRIKAGGLTADGLWEAFASAYPRRYKNPAVMNKARQVLRDMSKAEAIEVLQNLAIDLQEGSGQKCFDDVVDYIS